LGGLLMELREKVRQRGSKIRFSELRPLPIPQFLLFGHSIKPIQSPDRKMRETAARTNGPETHGVAMPTMKRRDRLRRVVLLCVHFARNVAYYRAGHGRLANTSPPFWITIDGNFLDTAVMEWCKLFGDSKDKHAWAKVVTDAAEFKATLLGHLGITDAEFATYVKEMRGYRDKFLAHLDDLLVMNIPHLDRAFAAVEHYHDQIVQHEAATGDLAGLPTNLAHYYRHCFEEAEAIYARCPV
jgi:hypothetical protein